jgi:hypothetical protein
MEKLRRLDVATGYMELLAEVDVLRFMMETLYIRAYSDVY